MPGPYDRTVRGMNFRLYPAENYCDRVLFGRGILPEQAEHEALLPLLSPGMVFVDIGANVGSYSAFVGTQLKGEVSLVAFEPHPETFKKLKFNLEANDLPTTDIRNVGIAGEASTMQLWSDGGSNIGHTSLLKDGTANPARSVEVKVVPLAPMLAELEIDRIDLLKIDIEGFEDRALSPFLEVAKKQLLPRFMLLETAHQALWERDLLLQLRECGYSEIFRTKENLLLSRLP